MCRKHSTGLTWLLIMRQRAFSPAQTKIQTIVTHLSMEQAKNCALQSMWVPPFLSFFWNWCNFVFFDEKTNLPKYFSLQMLMHFIPKLKYSNYGHFVTIQPIISNKKPLLSSYREIKDLINLLIHNQQPTYALDLFTKQKIHLTTVLWNCDNVTNTPVTCNGQNNNINRDDLNQMTDRILDGIRADRSVVHINKSFNFIDSIRNYFQKKKKNITNVNYNGQNKVR